MVGISNIYIYENNKDISGRSVRRGRRQEKVILYRNSGVWADSLNRSACDYTTHTTNRTTNVEKSRQETKILSERRRASPQCRTPYSITDQISHQSYSLLQP
jgi:hypothetical protein